MTEEKKPIHKTEEYKMVVEGMPTHETMDPLTSFFYELMRDHVPPGLMLEYVVRAQGEGPHILSNGYLAKFAEHLALKLRAPTPPPVEVNHHQEESFLNSDSFRSRKAERTKPE